MLILTRHEESIKARLCFVFSFIHSILNTFQSISYNPLQALNLFFFFVLLHACCGCGSSSSFTSCTAVILLLSFFFLHFLYRCGSSSSSSSLCRFTLLLLLLLPLWVLHVVDISLMLLFEAILQIKMTFFQKNPIRIINPYGSYGLAIRMTHTNC